MATNPPPGPGRIGQVKKRSQVHNKKIKRFVKVDNNSGLFMDQMERKETPFKGVRKK